VIAAGAAWVTAIAAGFCLVNGHAATPVESPVVTDPTRANLVMLIHPRCPCSRASLAGLEKILTVCRSYLVAHVFFLEPKVPTTAWGDTELRRRAAAIPMTDRFSTRAEWRQGGSGR
jgi:hypothetical protein